MAPRAHHDEGYHPSKTTLKPEALQVFVAANLTGDLTEIPGMGQASAERLMAGEPDGERIMNAFQLVGKFLMLKQPVEGGDPVSCADHCNRFYHWLRYKGVTTRPHTITNAIAEKINVAYPGLYDPSEFDEKPGSAPEK